MKNLNSHNSEAHQSVQRGNINCVIKQLQSIKNLDEDGFQKNLLAIEFLAQLSENSHILEAALRHFEKHNDEGFVPLSNIQLVNEVKKEFEENEKIQNVVNEMNQKTLDSITK